MTTLELINTVYGPLKTSEYLTAGVGVHWWVPDTNLGYFRYKNAEGWNLCGSSSGGGVSRRFPDEYSDFGPANNLIEHLTTMINYFTKLNENGVGRFLLLVNVNPSSDNDDDDEELEKKYGNLEKYDMSIIIDKNREFDSSIYNAPYKSKGMLGNWNFKDNGKDDTLGCRGIITRV